MDPVLRQLDRLLVHLLVVAGRVAVGGGVLGGVGIRVACCK